MNPDNANTAPNHFKILDRIEPPEFLNDMTDVASPYFFDGRPPAKAKA